MIGLGLVDDDLSGDSANTNRARRTRLDTGWRLIGSQPVLTHIALAHDALGLAVTGHVVGALQDAILTADALVIEMPYDSGNRIFLVGINRASVEAGRLDAMVAGGRHVLQHGKL